MDKIRQRELLLWLKQQSAPAQHWLRFTLLLGLMTGLLVIAQAWLLAQLLQNMIIEHQPKEQVSTLFLLLFGCIALKALLAWLREVASFRCGASVRQALRQRVLAQLQRLGPAWVQSKPSGSWSTIILEQIEEMQDYYARYLPQMYLAVLLPICIIIAIAPINWTAALILFITAPLIPLFMAMVGMGAADANRRNFTALRRLSGHFLDRLRGLDTLRLFHRAEAETAQITQASEDFRRRTMEVLKLAFLSSAVLEFFASVSIAVVAVYFGFSYLGEFHFGGYGAAISLSAGFLALILAPEFFQPLRDLGTYYHAKAQAIAAAESLVELINQQETQPAQAISELSVEKPMTLTACNLVILSITGNVLAGPLNFHILPNEKIAIIGHSGAGKSSLLNLLLGFLPYQGSIKINDVELRELNADHWRTHLSWVGQNPYLPANNLRDNVLLGHAQATDTELDRAISEAYVDEFLAFLPHGWDTLIGDDAARLSVGQAQRVAVARALIKPRRLLLLDEPTASLDANSEHLVNQSLKKAINQQTTLLVTHRLDDLHHFDHIWVMSQGKIIQTGHYDELCKQLHSPFAALLSARNQEL